MIDRDRQLVADLLNEIFHLQLDWFSFESAQLVSKPELKTLESLLRELSPRLKDPTVLKTLWVVTQANKSMNRSVLDVFTDESALPYRKKLGGAFRNEKSFTSLFSLLQNITERGVKNLPAPKTRGEIDAQFDDFLLMEKRILQDAGLDQAAIQTIMMRLVKRRRQIVQNIHNRKVIYPERYNMGVDVAVNTVSSILSMKTTNGAVTTKRMKNVKDKIVGLATIWADLTPIIFGQDFGVASFWSGIAGAAALVAVPSYENDTRR